MSQLLMMTRYLWFLSTLFVAVLLLQTVPAQALLPAHLALDGCATCHSLHSSPGGTLFIVAGDSSNLCLSCHGLGGISSLKATIHNLNGGEVVCNECHNSHNNDDLNVNGANNVNLIGLTIDYNSDPVLNLSSPQIRKERVATGLGALQDVIFELSPNDWDRTEIDGLGDGLGICNACHGDLTTPIHNRDQDCTGCHAHDSGFVGSGDCRACHDGSGLSDAEKVSVDSPHSTNTIFTSIGVTFTCENCHTAHQSGNVQVANNITVGIDYSSTGHNGISFGADGTNTNDAVGDSEAKICWNCHDLYGVSEWGGNTDTNGVGFPDYDTGSLSTSNWVGTWDGASGTTAIWSSANFTYKESNIQSTHSVNDVDGVSGKDVVGDLRCSYCHDVHDLNSASGDTASGKPYLRGSWVGNPYNEDGAPSNIAGGLPGDIADYSAYDVGGLFGAVPRGGTAYNSLGGYFIDQNSGSPTADALMDSPDEFAGLCVLCHENGNADGLWDAAEIDTINKFGTPSDDWVGANGHAAVVKGGGASVAINLFTMAKRHPTTAWAAYTGNGSHRGNPVMAYRNARDINKGTWQTSYWAQGLRGTDSTAFQYSPRVDINTRQYNYGGYNWGATVVVENADGTMSDSGIDNNFHQFTCSKCHNPHASRLPRLLITNCLDTSHNTWADSYVIPNNLALAVENRSIPFSQATSAQNCHRLADPGYPQAAPQGTTTGGWNRVSPW